MYLEDLIFTFAVFGIACIVVYAILMWIYVYSRLAQSCIGLVEQKKNSTQIDILWAAYDKLHSSDVQRMTERTRLMMVEEENEDVNESARTKMRSEIADACGKILITIESMNKDLSRAVKEYEEAVAKRAIFRNLTRESRYFDDREGDHATIELLQKKYNENLARYTVEKAKSPLFLLEIE